MRHPSTSRFAGPMASSFHRATATTVVAAMLLFSTAAAAHWRERAPASVEIMDRTTGATLAVYDKDGQRYVVGTPGHEYVIRIRNETRERILAVTSVDGVNVVTGDTASPGQSGYVIEPNGSVEIAGWRRSLSATSAFYFTDLGDSYAARTGRPDDVGVIGVAVFRERRDLAAERRLRDQLAAHEGATRAEPPLFNNQRSPADAAAATTEASRADARAATGEPLRAEAPASSADAPHAQAEAAANAAASRPVAKLGTGFGRDEASYAQRVRFERATETPAQTIAIRYDRYENLAAMGVFPTRRYAERTPDPFPALRFVPPPR